MNTQTRPASLAHCLTLYLSILGWAPVEAAAPSQPVPIAPGTVFQRHRIGLGAQVEGSCEGPAERLIYGNTFGRYAIAIPANALIADDIATTASAGCKLRRLEFPIVGKVNADEAGGPYTVSFAIYSNCPGAVPAQNRPSLIIPGTQRQLTFPDDGPQLISVTLSGSGVAIPSNLWFGVSFNRANAGIIVGAPAQTGFSCDSFDSPGFPCSGTLGGFPEHPHASINLELFGDTSCETSFVGYKNSKPSGSVYNPGVDRTLVDDITLGVPECQMTAYEVAIKGVGFYEFDMRRNCEGSLIAGTSKQAAVESGNDVRIRRFTFDPPIALPDEFFFATSTGNSIAGIVTTGVQACVGKTLDHYFVPGKNGCGDGFDVPGIGLHSGVNLTITCAGMPPVGACCDMYFPDEAGDSVCRAVPQMNCPFPRRFSLDRPEWVPNAACDPDPFSPVTCGKAACCKPNDACSNLTLNECNAVTPLDSPRQWQLGRICNQFGQHCPLNACLDREGNCTVPHSTPGCDDPNCCDAICRQDFYCCTIEWDESCVKYTGLGVREYEFANLENDVCAPEGRRDGAKLIILNPSTGVGSSTTIAWAAFEDADDPGFGCYIGDPGAKGTQTVWYKFIATHSSMQIWTCGSTPPADDSLLAVYAVGDPTDEITQCNSLIPIGCSDDAPGCGSSNKNSKVCVDGLMPGNWYYVLVASKYPESHGGYRVNITAANCTPTLSNDFCLFATTIGDGTTAFNLSNASMDAPAESCIPTMINDSWYNYTATCTGVLKIDTCGADAASSPDTNLAIYDDALCPPLAGAPIACSSDAGGNCGFGSRAYLDVVEGRCYKLRMADSNGNRPSGELHVRCEHADCPGGPIVWQSPPDSVVDAGRPYDPNDAQRLDGIKSLTATLTPNARPECFSLCETAGGGSPNSIFDVVENPPGMYTLTLARPIAGGAKTTITYRGVNGAETNLRMISHPGNVNADGFADEQDVADLLSAFCGAHRLPFDMYSGDIDRSGVITPGDLLDLVDLLIGAKAYEVWSGSANPVNDPNCP